MKRLNVSVFAMLRAAAVVIALAMSVAFFGGCSEDYAIEGHKWQFTFAQTQSGEITLCSQQESALYPDAEIVEISLVAEGGALTVTEDGSATEYVYSVQDRSAGGTIYVLESDGKSCGIASVGVTSYADGTGEYTLIVTVDGNSCYFIAPAE